MRLKPGKVTVRETLRELVLSCEGDICDDARRCKALLCDVYGSSHRKEIFALTSAISEGIPAELSSVTSGIPTKIVIGRCVRQMHDNLGISQELCEWAVETWVYALTRDGGSDQGNTLQETVRTQAQAGKEYAHETVVIRSDSVPAADGESENKRQLGLGAALSVLVLVGTAVGMATWLQKGGSTQVVGLSSEQLDAGVDARKVQNEGEGQIRGSTEDNPRHETLRPNTGSEKGSEPTAARADPAQKERSQIQIVPVDRDSAYPLVPSVIGRWRRVGDANTEYHFLADGTLHYRDATGLMKRDWELNGNVLRVSLNGKKLWECQVENETDSGLRRSESHLALISKHLLLRNGQGQTVELIQVSNGLD